MDKKMILIYVILGVIILGLVVLTFFPGMIYVFRDSGVLGNSVEGSNKCVAPEGYTQQKWEEHMGHHPSMYKECLN